MTMVQREVRKRGFFGKVAKLLFIAFNLLMLLWVVLAIMAVSDSPVPDSEAGKAGAVVGGFLGFGLIMVIWTMGDIILGLWVMFTRGERVLISETK